MQTSPYCCPDRIPRTGAAWFVVAALGLVVVSAPAAPAGDAIPPLAGQITVDVGGLAIDVFTYKPANYRKGPLFVVCHGMLRNAEEYRENARGLADRLGAVVAAPRFDLERFPIEAYQLGGILRQGQLRPTDEWTVTLVPKIVQEIRQREANAELDYCLIGHSAGAQFLGRLSGTTDIACQRIVLANAGTHLFPTRELPFPYGFGGLPDELADDAALRRYLAQKLTIYLGTSDLGDRNLPKSEVAMKQGATRYERGKRCFELGQQLANKNGWPFGWRLIEAPEVGHDSRAMFDHENAAEALRQ